MKTRKRTPAMLLLLAALFIAVLRPSSAEPGGKEGIVGLEFRGLEVGVAYCVDRQGEDRCMSARPILKTGR